MNKSELYIQELYQLCAKQQENVYAKIFKEFAKLQQENDYKFDTNSTNVFEQMFATEITAYKREYPHDEIFARHLRQANILESFTKYLNPNNQVASSEKLTEFKKMLENNRNFLSEEKLSISSIWSNKNKFIQNVANVMAEAEVYAKNNPQPLPTYVQQNVSFEKRTDEKADFIKIKILPLIEAQLDFYQKNNRSWKELFVDENGRHTEGSFADNPGGSLETVLKLMANSVQENLNNADFEELINNLQGQLGTFNDLVTNPYLPDLRAPGLDKFIVETTKVINEYREKFSEILSNPNIEKLKKLCAEQREKIYAKLLKEFEKVQPINKKFEFDPNSFQSFTSSYATEISNYQRVFLHDETFNRHLRQVIALEILEKSLAPKHLDHQEKLELFKKNLHKERFNLMEESHSVSSVWSNKNKFITQIDETVTAADTANNTERLTAIRKGTI